MKDVREILRMKNILEENISDHGWDCAVDAVSLALAWVLDDDRHSFSGGSPQRELQRLLNRPDAARRREWIARGGDPMDWPIGKKEDPTHE